MTAPCPICGEATALFGTAIVRHKYEGRFLQCGGCGFLFAESTPWLAEAYAQPINDLDTGYVERNLWCRGKVRMCIELFLNPDGQFLDHAAGYGLFVRLMRDLGYEFRWSDRYCENLFARGFEAPVAGPATDRYEAITAFEVLEHLTNPLEEIGALLAMTGCLLVTTTLLPKPAPKLGEWWYHGLDHGQHVGFYTAESLRRVAAKFGCHVFSDGVFHVFTDNPAIEKKFRRINSRFSQRWIAKTRGRKSMAHSDHEALAKRGAVEHQPPKG